MKTQISVIAMAMILAMTSCGASKATAVSVTDQKQMPKQTGYVAEVEVTFPCQDIDSDAEFLRVNGQGTSKDRVMARKRAYTDALARLSTKLKGVASSMESTVGVSTVTESGESFHDKMIATAEVIAKAHVDGYRTSCEKFTVNPSTGAYTCYCTIEFGKQQLVKEFHEKLSQDQVLRADYDFDRYMEVFDKKLKEYEAANQ